MTEVNKSDKDLFEQPSVNTANEEWWFTVRDKVAIKSLGLAFLPSWWNKNYKVSFGEKYFFDPDYRVETTRYMSRTIKQHFPDLHIGSKNPQPEVVMPGLINATGVATAGGEVFFFEDSDPWDKHLPYEAIEKLKFPENIEEVFPYNEVVSQTKYLNNKLGKDKRPYLWRNGVLNDAIHIMGDKMLLGLANNDDVAKQVLDYSYGMFIKVMDYNYRTDSFPEFSMIANCTAVMVGPSRYENSLYSYDRNIIQRFYDRNQKFMLHHCGKFDNFIASYRRIPHIDMLQIGFESNVKSALEAFPEAILEYLYSPYLLMHGSRSDIREKTNEILESSQGNWDRFSIAVADVDYGVPDENLLEIYECCKKAL
jgi:uroporphyrinogen-III decarboxylase